MTEQHSEATAPAALPADLQILEMASAPFITQALYVAAKLGIADLLRDGPKTAGELAGATDTDERSLYRILRALASVGVFSETGNRTFVNTAASETLRSDAPNSTRYYVMFIGEEPHWRNIGHTMYSVKTGKPAWEHVHGVPCFPYLFNTNKELGEIFNRAMISFSHQDIAPVLNAYDFSDVGKVADIAGGYGHLLAAVLKKYPSTTGVLFELPQLIDRARAFMESTDVTDRVEFVAGDFCKEIPVRADVYLIKHIIHDWYDDTNQVILKNIRDNMPDKGRVLIIDAVIQAGNEPHLKKILDIEMLIAPGGVERTAEEFETLLNNSGFRLNRIIPTASPNSILEAVKE
jgi:O-methyltransferase domain/Dimerisation domain